MSGRAAGIVCFSAFTRIFDVMNHGDRSGHIK